MWFFFTFKFLTRSLYGVAGWTLFETLIPVFGDQTKENMRLHRKVAPRNTKPGNATVKIVLNKRYMRCGTDCTNVKLAI